MGQTRTSRIILAPIGEVFDSVAHIDRFREVIPHITDVEYLTESTRGVGTRFRETRVMKNRAATTELEVTEYVEPRRVRLVSDSGGAIWDTVFALSAAGDATQLDMVMDARPHTLMARFVVPLFGRMVAKAVEADMDAIKDYCERR